MSRIIAAEPNAKAPDGSDVPLRLETTRGSMAHFALSSRKVSRAVAHKTIEEIWYATNSLNYSGSIEEIRRYCLFGAQASGNADRFKGFAEACMAEYDLDGWKVPDLTDPGELSYHMLRK